MPDVPFGTPISPMQRIREMLMRPQPVPELRQPSTPADVAALFGQQPQRPLWLEGLRGNGAQPMSPELFLQGLRGP